MLDCLLAHRTRRELDAGLRQWVEHFKEARHNGNVEFAREIQKNIDAVIERKNLDRSIVYGSDPDAPHRQQGATP